VRVPHGTHTRAWRPSAARGQTRDTRHDLPTNQPTNQPIGQQPFCQYPAVSWELRNFMAHGAV